MLAILEKTLKDMKMARKLYPNTPEKYLKLNDKKAIQLKKDIDRIYKKYSELRKYEEYISNKYDIEIM